ncbi:DUF397 domain-containing protein [Streptomyces chattanoogensis]|uniref:DUF397 domain-containing protein n=1 Tax=Streptomyces chattanoogensis TaxID=66876 RepID=A0A0N0H4G2_9ACTN|nr:DUF397 domain-containing protein [Streptomyces chattanoogensis]KPC67091.1 hypothetical protein ADL29_02725 [Streptomyces chattanoogensis]
MTNAAAPKAVVDTLVWFKSSYSSDEGGACIEVATCSSPHPTIHIRDSKNPNGPTLTLGATAWAAFVADIQHGVR